MRQDRLISASHLLRGDIEAVLDHAADIGADPTAFRQRHAGKVFGLCLSESNTRTWMSFDSMTKCPGGQTVDAGPVESLSVEKGETFAGTVRVVKGYADALVFRHPSEGAATVATEFVDVSFVNAGDGTGQHPSQTFLGLHTIRENAGLGDLIIGIMGDLKYGQTVHSLAGMLTNFDASQHFISPEGLRPPRNVCYDLHASDAQVREHTEPNEAFPEFSVLYVTRIQRECFLDENEYRRVAGQYRVDSEMLNAAADDLTIMHPLPRVDKVPPGIDDTNHATYFEQVHNGAPVRIALLDILSSQDR